MNAKEREKRRIENEIIDAENRSRGITVGTAHGGTTEITMRGVGGKFLYSLMQPVEVIELIHQLSANVGCHLQLVPRQDFASWRDWKVTDEALAHARGDQALPGVGYPPFVNNISDHIQLGANLQPPDEQVGLKEKSKEKKNVATKKIVNKRSTKRSRATSK